MKTQQKKQSALYTKTQVRFNASMLLQLAIEDFMREKGVSKGEAIETFLLGSVTLKERMGKIESFHGEQ